jgi:CBS domain-containing protein
MKASDIMTKEVYVVSPKDTVAHVKSLMFEHKISRVPVLKEGTLVGIITRKDIAYRLRQSEPVWRRRPIDRIPAEVVMSPDPIIIRPDTKVQQIASIMMEKKISGLLVVENDSIDGIVTKSDLLRSDAVGSLSMKAIALLSHAEQVSRYHSLDHVIDILSEQIDKVVVVNNDGTLAGIITESNLALYNYYINDTIGLPEKDIQMLRREKTGGRKWFRYTMEVSAVAEDVMSRPVITVGSDASLQDVIKRMREHHINCVVVADGKDLKGIVKRDTIIQEVAK